MKKTKRYGSQEILDLIDAYRRKMNFILVNLIVYSIVVNSISHFVAKKNLYMYNKQKKTCTYINP